MMRPLLSAQLAALAVLCAMPSASFAQPAPAPAAPVGLVDQPCPAGTTGRSPAVVAVAQAMVKDGPMDMASLMKSYGKHVAEQTKIDQEHAKVDWANLCLYRAENEATKPGEVNVVFLGDSITELWRVADPDLFTKGVVDRGISGQTSPQALLRFYPDVVALHPRAVHIMIGTNDVAGNTGPNRPEDLKNNIRAMVEIAKANHIKVILASMLPASTFTWNKALHPGPQIKALNTWLADYAQKEGLIYADYYSLLANAEGGMKDGTSRDGVHPLVSGYAIMRSTAEGVINRALVDAKR